MRRCICAVLTIFCLMLTARADIPSEPDPQHVYVGNGQILMVSAARQLTLHANVGQVLYQPGSLEAAYTNTEINGDTLTDCVRLVGLKRGETATLLSDIGPAEGDDAPNPYTLVGWSGDGRFLLTSHLEPAEGTGSPQTNYITAYKSVDVGVLPPKVRRVPLPEEGAENGTSVGEMQPSPSGKVFAIEWRDAPLSRKMMAPPPQVPPRMSAPSAFLYDAAKDSLRRIPLPMGSYLQGWADDTHLVLLTHTSTSRQYVTLDIDTGKEMSAKSKSTDLKPIPRRFPEVQLSLLTVPLLVPGPDLQSAANDDSLWLSIAGAKPKLPSVRLALFTAPNDAQESLAPDQSSALWLQHGDLFLSHFTVDAATAREKYDAGEALTCDEERDIAASNTKQIGLSLLQYTQDYDEQFPPAEDFRSGVIPYLQNTSLLAVRQYPFQYTAPDDLHLANMESPADTVLGTITLPCAVVTLYADGHVKALPPSASP